MKSKPIAFIILLNCSTLMTLRAASYSEAEFTRLEKDVKVLKENSAPHKAALGEQLRAVTSVATGMSSRAELRFPDKTLTRLGSNSRFTLRGDARTLDLNEGVMMLSVPKKMGGAKIRTSTVTAALTGTTVEFEFSVTVDRRTHKKKEMLKVIVVEGSVDLFRTNKPRDFITIPAGKMIIMDPNGPWQALVDVDIKRLRKTSPLLNEDDGPLPNSEHINDAVQAQQVKLGSGELIATSLMIPGRGTQVSITTATALNAIETNALLNVPAPETEHIVVGSSSSSPPKLTGLPQIPGSSVLNNTSTIKTDPFVTTWNSLKQDDLTSHGAIYHGPTDGPFSKFAFGANGNPNNISGGGGADGGLQELPANVAAFRFDELIVNGSPVFDLAAPTPAQVVTYVILAADNNITIGPDTSFAGSPHPGSTSPVSSETSLDIPSTLDVLGFWSNQGSIHLKAGFTINGGTKPGQFLALTAAGPQSDTIIEGGIHLIASALAGSNRGAMTLEAARDVILQGSQAVITADPASDGINFNAGHNLLVDGATITAPNFQLHAGNNLTVQNGAVLTATLGPPLVPPSGYVDSLLLESNRGDVQVTNSTLSSAHYVQINAGKDSPLLNGSLTLTNTGITANGPAVNFPNDQPVINLQAFKDITINISDSSQFKVLSTDAMARLNLFSTQGNIGITGNGGGASAPDTLFSGNALQMTTDNGSVTLTNIVVKASDVQLNTGNNNPANINSNVNVTNTSIIANVPATIPVQDHGIQIQAVKDITINISNSSQFKSLATDPLARLQIQSSNGNTSITGNGGGSAAADTLFSGNRLEIYAHAGDVSLTSMAATASNFYIQAGGSGSGSITLTNADLTVNDPAVLPTIEHGLNLQAKKDNTINISDTSQIKLLSTDANAVLRIFAENGDLSITGNGGGSSATDTLFSGNSMEIDSAGGNVTLSNLAATANDVRIIGTGANSNVTLTNTDIVANAPAVPPGQEHGIYVSATKNVTINISDSSQLKVLANDPNAVLKLLSGQGNISVTGNGSATDTLSSGRDIYIDASAGNVTLTNMVATAQNAFRARANGPNGLLTVSGSTINAGNLIRLYAEGATGGVLFVGSVNLNTTGAVHISGNTVKVQTGGAVSIPTGTADIFANLHDYNLNAPGNASHGSINGPSITPHAGTSGRPAF